MTQYKTTLDWMQDAYYGVNPRPHSEKAYQRNDSSPPVAPKHTFVGPKGTVVIMVTSIRNRTPSGTGKFSVLDGNHKPLREGAVSLPGVAVLSGFTPGARLHIQPRTMGTMAKILTPGQLTSAGKPFPPPRA